MDDNVQKARDSLSRCIATPAFLDRFYELFLESSPDIQRKFASTDFDRQKKVLQDSLFVMLVAAGTSEGYAHRELEKLARHHSRNELDIKPEWYTLWLDCLVKAVSEHDPDYSPKLETSWREALKDGIALMKAKY